MRNAGARLAIPGSYNLLALLDGRPAGMASGVPTARRDTAELISLWVAPHARGRGVGDLLIGEVGRWAEGAVAGVLRLAVRPANHHAIALYRRHGFTLLPYPGGPSADHRATGPGQAVEERVMAKALGSCRCGPPGPPPAP